MILGVLTSELLSLGILVTGFVVFSGGVCLAGGLLRAVFRELFVLGFGFGTSVEGVLLPELLRG